MKKTEYKIVDNFLGLDDFKKLEELMLGKYFSWYYNPDVTFKNVDSPHTMYFTHLFYNAFTVQSNLFSEVEPILRLINPKALIRIKGNLYPNIGKNIADLPHTDYEYPHKGALLYINTNNGCTVLEDGTEIKSIANRLLMFAPHKLHNSTYCTDEKVRVNININYF
jgi:hypothetical protein